jgi:hypothetical protein
MRVAKLPQVCLHARGVFTVDTQGHLEGNVPGA